MPDLLLAHEVFLARFSLISGRQEAWPRWAGAEKMGMATVAGSVVLELVSGGSAVLETQRARFLGGLQQVVVPTAERPTDPVLSAVFDSIASRDRAKSVSSYLTSLANDIDIVARLEGLGLLARGGKLPKDLELTAAGLDAARESRAELDAWITRDDLPVPSAEVRMGLSAPTTFSPLSAHARELGALLRAGAVWQRTWSGVSSDKSRSIAAQLSVLLNESFVLTQRGPEWRVVLEALQKLNADFVG